MDDIRVFMQLARGPAAGCRHPRGMSFGPPAIATCIRVRAFASGVRDRFASFSHSHLISQMTFQVWRSILASVDAEEGVKLRFSPCGDECAAGPTCVFIAHPLAAILCAENYKKYLHPLILDSADDSLYRKL